MAGLIQIPRVEFAALPSWFFKLFEAAGAAEG